MDRGVRGRGLGALALGLTVATCSAPAAADKGPDAARILEVRAASPAVPVELRGELHGFGLTPFQLRDMPAGQYVVQVRQGEFERGASRLTVLSVPEGTRFEVGSVRGRLLLESALLPGLGHFQTGDTQRAGTAFGQTALAAIQAWSAERDRASAARAEAQALQAYRAERDAANLAARRSTLRDAEVLVADRQSERQRWLGVTAWAYACNLLDLYCDARPVATLATTPEGGRRLDVSARSTSHALALLRGTLHPGSGHYALDHPWRGLAFEVLSSAGVYACLQQQSKLDSAKRQYIDAHNRYLAASEDDLAARRTVMESAYTGWSAAHRRRNAALLSTGAVWALGVLDVLWSEPARTPPEFGSPRRAALSLLRPADGGIGAQLAARF